MNDHRKLSQMIGICSARVPRAMEEAMKDHPIARGTRALQGGL